MLYVNEFRAVKEKEEEKRRERRREEKRREEKRRKWMNALCVKRENKRAN